jgi:hypothetical protein
MIAPAFLVVVLLLAGCVAGLKPYSGSVKPRPVTPKKFGNIRGQNWDGFEGLECTLLGEEPVPASTVTHPGVVFKHTGDEDYDEGPPLEDGYEKMKNAARDANIGRALEVLRRELPYIFATSDHDFSIFAPSITVADGKNNKMVMQKPLYIAAVNSLRVASRISSIYPSMNVRKIEYISESSTIQCLVDVVLPDTVRVDGQAMWEGMFYFGLDKEGLVDSHVMDRKVSNFTPSPAKKAAQMPWLRAAPAWSGDLVKGAPLPTPIPGFVKAIVEEEENEETYTNHPILELFKR